MGLALLSACAAPCPVYPDRRTPLCAFQTFLQAMRTADQDVIEDSFTPARLAFHQAEIKTLGLEGKELLDWYSRYVDRFDFGPPDVEDLGGAMAHVRVPVTDLRPRGMKGHFLFEFISMGPEWKIFRIRRSGFGPGSG